MKLVFILNSRLPTERAHGLQSVRMCEAFVESGVDVTMVVPRRWQNNPELRDWDVFDFYGVPESSRFPIQRIPHIDLLPLEDYVGLKPLKPFFIATNFSFAISAATKAKTMRADLYFTREWTVAWWLVKYGLPTVYEAHVVDGMSFSSRAGAALRSASQSENMVKVVAITNAVKYDLILDGVPEEKIVVLPDAVDIHRYATDTSAPPPLGEKDRPVALYTGSIYESQGVYVLADAAKHIPEVKMLILGGSPEDLERARSYVSQHNIGNVELPGHMPPTQIPGYQQSADVLVYTPLGDDAQHLRYASPLKLFQYMASGRPIVSTDLPSVREVLEDGKNALLVPPNDPEAVANAIRKLLDDPELGKRLASNAWEDVQELTWRNRVNKLLESVKDSLAVASYG